MHASAVAGLHLFNGSNDAWHAVLNALSRTAADPAPRLMIESSRFSFLTRYRMTTCRHVIWSCAATSAVCAGMADVWPRRLRRCLRLSMQA